MDRRTFLQSTGAPLGAAALGSVVPSLVQAASAGRAATPPRSAVTDVVVIGGGAFGVWTALTLREMGHQVTLLDAYGPGSSRATSGDETRQIRVGYGDREGYARMAHRAMDAWTAREAEFGVPLLVRTGRLEIAPTWTPALRATQAMLARFGVATEAFTVDELRRRYPQMGFDGIGVGLLEPGAGVVRAKQAILAAAAAFARKGGTVVVQRAEPGRAEGGRLVDVALADGSRLAAQQFVFACGPWLPKVFPDLLGRRIRVPKRDVLYFGVPAGDTRFAPPALPNFSESTYYGFPSINGRGEGLSHQRPRHVGPRHRRAHRGPDAGASRAPLSDEAVPCALGAADHRDARLPAREHRGRALHHRPAPVLRQRAHRRRWFRARLQARPGPRGVRCAAHRRREDRPDLRCDGPPRALSTP